MLQHTNWVYYNINTSPGVQGFGNEEVLMGFQYIVPFSKGKRGYIRGMVITFVGEGLFYGFFSETWNRAKRIVGVFSYITLNNQPCDFI